MPPFHKLFPFMKSMINAWYLVILACLFILAGCQTSSHEVSEETGGISHSAYKAFTDNSPKNGYPDYRAFFYSKTNDAYGFSYDYSSVV